MAGSPEPIEYTLSRIGEGPNMIKEAGQLGLSRLVQVTPAPDPNPELLRTLSLRHNATLRRLTKMGDKEAIYEAKTTRGQNVEAMGHLETLIDEFGIFINAASGKSDEYVQVLYPETENK